MKLDDFKKRFEDVGSGRYEKRIHALRNKGLQTNNIEAAVNDAVANVNQGHRSFIIYGEPQSGKTEMMIALTAKLLDEGHKIIIILLNDSIQLLQQNLDRFIGSGISPTPRKFNYILDPDVKVTGREEFIIFSKKNAKDLAKLLDEIKSIKGKVIIDDEADYATPNSKINQQDQTRINELVGGLYGEDGIYIGVTATPARLDLNNVFKNDHTKWVEFKPHDFYAGPDVFFPSNQDDIDSPKFNLRLLPESGDDPKHLRGALFRFLVNSAYLNVEHSENGYVMLVHQSGKIDEHSRDYSLIVNTFSALEDSNHPKFDKYISEIYGLVESGGFGSKAESVMRFITDNIRRREIITMNSSSDKDLGDYARATHPKTPFTIAIGGNIVSRGVTFDRLLTMFFTRDAKHKIQQDTYIQRARMFGTRGQYLQYFELYIPKSLYWDWHRCFVYHRLSITSLREGSPAWLADVRIQPVAANSIDKSTAIISGGEISYGIFDYTPQIHEVVSSETMTHAAKLESLVSLLGDEYLPKYLVNFINSLSPNGELSLAVHPPSHLGETYKTANLENIRRKDGASFMGSTYINKYPRAIHQLKIWYTDKSKARLIYKFTNERIRFIGKRQTN